MLEKGHIATVWHAGSNSYYEATIIRRVSRQEMIAVSKASAGEDPLPDGTIFQEVLRAALDSTRVKWSYYNDISADRKMRRLKAASVRPTPAQLIELDKEARRRFGDRVLEVGVTPPPNDHAMRWGGEFYVRLTAF